MDIRELLNKVASGEISTEQALLEMKMAPLVEGYKLLGETRLDTHRKIRQGISEVIFGEGKSVEQLKEILNNIEKENNIIITRLCSEKANALQETFTIDYFEKAKIAVFNPEFIQPCDKGYILVVSAGTSDMSVAEEAAVTAKILGNEVRIIHDVGVAGLHRLLSELPEIMQARVIIAVAGMEGALVSVLGGLVDCPVIAVPTSVGYGSNLNGITTLHAMLSSCASGVSVVNIDNGFGAGYLASMMNKM